MYREIYEELRRSIEENLSIIQYSKKFFINRKYNEQFLDEFQELLMKLSGVLEEYNLHGTEIIDHLKKVCAEIDKLIELPKNEILENICNDIDIIEEKLEKSCEINDVELALVCIIRNEARYIKEWVNFHRLVGVKHFYIYDNESTDNVSEVLEKFIKKGIVDLIPYPGNCVQLKAYNEAIDKYKYECKYMGFVDADEFVTPIEDGKKIYEIIDELKTLIRDSRFYANIWNFGGVAINWRMYGTSFHEKRQNGLLFDDYIYRAEDDYIENSHVKTICDPRYILGFEGNSHMPLLREGTMIYSENGTPLFTPWMHDAKYKKLMIAHYYSKSLEEFKEKLKRGWPDLTHKEIDFTEEWVMEKIKWLENYNVVKDTFMTRFSNKLSMLDAVDK